MGSAHLPARLCGRRSTETSHRSGPRRLPGDRGSLDQPRSQGGTPRSCRRTWEGGRLTMASIARRPDGRWRARYRDPSGRERAKHFRRKVDAERFLTTVESAKLKGAYVDPDDRTTVAE